jgi:prepilin-type N-terminal cleavage/methylation domain-containing protein
MIARVGRRLRPPAGDRGFSLMEVMVGSALMSVVMAIATAGFVQMYHATEKSDSAAQAQANLADAFGKLDREIRYAYRINAAYSIGTTGYGVDYVIDDGSGTLQCVQLSLPVAGGALLRLQWPQPSTSADAAAISTGIATDLSSGAAGGSPFTVRSAATDGSNFDRLVMNVNSTVGAAAGSNSTRSYNLQFTALNTTLDAGVKTTCVKA